MAGAAAGEVVIQAPRTGARASGIHPGRWAHRERGTFPDSCSTARTKATRCFQPPGSRAVSICSWPWRRKLANHPSRCAVGAGAECH